MMLPHPSRRRLLASGLGAAAAVAVSRGALAQGAPLIIGAGADPIYTPWFLAKHEKMFEADQLNVTVQSYTDGGEAMNALVAQQVGMAGGAEPTTILRMGRADLRPLAVFVQSGTYIKLVARKEVASPDAIRKIGVVAGTVSEYSTGLMMKKFAMDQSAMQFVRSGPPELPALLARGDIDAYFAWEPWPGLGVRQGGHVLLNSGDVGYSTSLWINVAAGWLEANADTAKAVLKVVANACSIVQRDPKRAAAAVQAVTKIPAAQTLSLLQDLEFRVHDFTDADMAGYDGIADFLAERKVTPMRVDYRRAMQRGFYQA